MPILLAFFGSVSGREGETAFFPTPIAEVSNSSRLIFVPAIPGADSCTENRLCIVRGQLDCLGDLTDSITSVSLYDDYDRLAEVPFGEGGFSLCQPVPEGYVKDVYLVFNGTDVVIPLFLEPGTVTIGCETLPEDDMFSIAVRGTRWNDVLYAASREHRELTYRMLAVSRDTVSRTDEERMRLIDSLMNRQENLFPELYRTYRETEFGPVLGIQRYYGTNNYRELREDLALMRRKLPGHPGLHALETVLLMMPGIQEGDAAPDFALPDASGDTVRLSDFRGKYVLLDFWSSVSGVNLDDFARLKNLPIVHDDTELVIVGVSTDLSRDVWLQTLRRYRPRGVQLLDHELRVSELYHLTNYPTRLLVDPEGRVIAKDQPLE